MKAVKNLAEIIKMKAVKNLARDNNYKGIKIIIGKAKS